MCGGKVDIGPSWRLPTADNLIPKVNMPKGMSDFILLPKVPTPDTMIDAVKDTKDMFDDMTSGGGAPEPLAGITPPPPDPATGGDTKDVNSQNIADSDVRRRKSLSKLRRGFLSTINTSPFGIKSQPALDIPTLANGLKARLGA